MRRVVMGHDESGKAVVLSDEDVPPITAAMLQGVEVYRLWELEGAPTLPVTSVPASPGGTYFPGPGGIRFGIVAIPPVRPEQPAAQPPPGDPAAMAAEMEAKLPEMAAAFDPDRPGMHTTRTVDYIVVLSGTGRMETDDGVDLHLRPGDTLIQNGTVHAWHNDGDEPFVIAFAMCGAQR